MPNKKVNEAYASAGYGRVSDYYGNLVTLNNLSKGVFSERLLILQTQVIEVYLQIHLFRRCQLKACRHPLNNKLGLFGDHQKQYYVYLPDHLGPPLLRSS